MRTTFWHRPFEWQDDTKGCTVSHSNSQHEAQVCCAILRSVMLALTPCHANQALIGSAYENASRHVTVAQSASPIPTCVTLDPARGHTCTASPVSARSYAWLTVGLPSL